ncbi:MAG: AbrB/MazE/SpoVT family DNA-binding domain-containing protein [Chloroflexota bacterium]|nr:AbrB/MazE/SpoVT family DNA-binding domain-containing protein [Chloroflexota bacterium]
MCERRPMDEVAEGLTTKADKIRALFRSGYSRSEIAGFLSVRYQYVRNVLVGSGFMETQLSQPLPEQEATPEGSAPVLVRTAIGPGGRVVIPAAYRKALEVDEGDYIVMQMDGDELRVVNDEKEFARVQEMIASYVPEGVSLVDELIAERRREAAAEEAEIAKVKARQAKSAATEPT